MALKPDRQVVLEDISYFFDQVASRGGIAVQKTAGSGVAMDQSAQEAEYAANGSGKVPIGILFNDVVNLDLTRQHLNQHKDEVQKGSKCTLMRNGEVTTDMIDPGVTPSAGDSVYLGPSGLIRNSKLYGGTADVAIGKFVTTKDEDGFARVRVDL